MRRGAQRLIAGLLAIVLTIQPATAWWECGHHIIAVMAFELMDQQTQSRAIELLKQHPRFIDDFKPAKPLALSEMNHWIIGRAGYWPDVARDIPEFNRPLWHYQLGSSLTIGSNVNVPETPGPLPLGATLETKELHIAQAIELCRQTLRSPSSPDSDKALAICWIAHLVGDAHQPCHAGALYADAIFVEGDRGANKIPTSQRKNLHALWDSLLGDKYDSGDIARRAREIKADKETWLAAGSAAVSLEPLEWLSESSEFAKSHVYTPDIVDAVTAAQRSGAAELEVINVSDEYLKAAGALAQKRAAFAAHRLAAVLSVELQASN